MVPQRRWKVSPINEKSNGMGMREEGLKKQLTILSQSFPIIQKLGRCSILDSHWFILSLLLRNRKILSKIYTQNIQESFNIQKSSYKSKMSHDIPSYFFTSFLIKFH